MDLEREEIVSICDSEVDACPRFLEQAVNITKEKPKTEGRHDDIKKIDKWIARLLFAQLGRLGALPEKGVSGEKTTLRKEAGIIDKYDSWWSESLNNLEARGYLRQSEGRQLKVVSESEYDHEAVWEKWESARRSLLEDSDSTASLELCESCLQSLPKILRGEVPATDIIFPRSSMEKVKDIYRGNTTNDYFNGALAELVQAYVKQRIDSAPDTRLRVIEIGAGTGGTTAMILPKLRPFAGNIEEYCYTDISKAFLFFAEDQYGADNPYLSYKLWDIEKPLAEQNIEMGGFDLAIAANVLHATKNIRQTLRNAKAALCRNGLILINEISANSLLLHLTFGLLDGWWLSEDTDLRIPGCPGLYPETWKRVMEEEGFCPVLFPCEAAHRLGQQIILAQSDGIVKQRAIGARDNEAPINKERNKENTSRLYAEESFKNIKAYIENRVLICLSETLRIDKEEIDIDTSFSEYGVDSILGVGFIDRVNECFSISMNTAIIFDYFSVETLTNHIHDTYKNHIRDQQKNAGEPVEENQNMGVDVPGKRCKKSDPQQRKEEFTTAASMKSTKRATPPEVAIIGMSGQFPKATDVKQFWRNLVEEIDGVDELPSLYLDQVRFYRPEPELGKTYCKWGGILEDRECFDPSFFNISPKEAKSMNPHQRLILQESWKTLEDAGYNPRSLAGSKVAVYVGAEPTGYAHETFTGSSEAIIASRLSYYLNLRGPAMVVNTGCSSSAAAIHLACESLRTGESRFALAGGVNATLSQSVLVGLSAMEMLSPTGRCRTFDEAGNGTIISEAVGMVLLKRLEDAVSDNDPIYGTICGSGVNQDGASNSITAPNGLAQEQLIKDVYKRYEINPEDISYVEAHGTGTRLGDPVEANALVRAFKHFTNKKGYCAIGSAKSHIGHTAAASGVVGLMKVLLSVRYHKIPKLLNFTKLNALIELEDSAFYIGTVLSAWESSNSKPLMAALNSFGHSGTNVHLVFREYVASPEIGKSATATRVEMPFLIPLSAKTEENLRAQAERLQTYLGHTLSAQPSDQVSGNTPNHRVQRSDLADIAYTLQVGREPMAHRVIFLAQNANELKEQLLAFYEGRDDILNCWKGQMASKKNRASLFSLDEDVDEIVNKWIKKLKSEKIARAWVQGLEVDWNLLYKENKPNRISLPTYPFAKERYWTSPAKELQVAESYANQAPAESINALKAPKAESTHRKQSDKPNNISLQYLPGDNNLTKKLDDRLRPSETLMPASIPSETVIMDEPEYDFHLQSNFTKESIQEQLKKSLAAALWVETGSVDVDKTFVDLGLDSIIAVEWIREINKQYNTKISVSKIYDYTNIRELSVFLEKEVHKHDVALRPAPIKSTSPLPVDKAELTHGKLSDKPNTISLQSLSDDTILTKKQDDRLRTTEKPMPASVPAEAGITNEPEYDFHLQSNFTKESIQEQLKKSLAAALWVETGSVDVDKTFVDLGLDSIIAVEWIREINKQYNTKINVSKIYDFTTIRELSVFLEKEVNKHDVALRPSPVKSTSPPSVDDFFREVKKDSSEARERKILKSEKSTIHNSNYKDLIAIVGMSGRYPDANNLEQYWNNLVNGINSIREIPKFRWDVQQYYDPRPFQSNKIYCKWLGGLDDIEYFDPLFFNISPKEAEGMDPQHRLFLQEGYKAFEDAGYSRQLLNNRKCGVYLGISNNEYGMKMHQNSVENSIVTGNSFAIAAARIAYYLNLKGPAMPIDTACSSSLVAAHLACRALANYEIDMALVGGVSIYLTPGPYIGMCAAGMLSPGGQCKTFDNSADGFVPGEGVGALVLKRLKDAEDNHDFIYGVIVGSGINQDGKTNGITAPSVKSQIELERGIYDRYQIDPESIGYVEMHGTGTKLGDPIELEALSTVFEERSSKKNYCAIGSVKTNIGHSSAAAGVASMQKVLLSLKDKKLPPTLNFKNPNEHFNFKNSSFYVNTDLKYWEAFSGAPRRAAISSFSFSGTNAHIVVEEYVPPAEALSVGAMQPARGQMIVLSAKDDERLKAVAGNLHTWLAQHPELSRNDLSSIAYTLQMGREAMEARLGLIVKSVDELQEKLAAFLDGEENVAGLYRGQVKRENDALAVFAGDEELQEALEKWIARGKYAKLLSIWVKGLMVDWHKLYGENKPRRISLPTYPFAKERCWISPAKERQETESCANQPQLHPLVHQNTSDLSEQRFTSTFNGNEFFLNDHRVMGRKVLPGAAYLEMARAAITRAVGPALEDDTTILQLENIAWVRPLTVNGNAQPVHMGLYPEEDGRIAYEVYTQDETNGTELVVHSQGTAALVQSKTAAMLDLGDLKARINQRKLTPGQCYDAFKAAGLEYGEAFRTIETLSIGANEVLARVSLPACVKETKGSFVLHPAVMDAAVQASIGVGDPSQPKPALPFALERLTILGPCNDSRWAWVRYSGNGSSSDRVQKLDMDLCDDTGTVCVQLRGFSSRVLEEGLPDAQKMGRLLLKPVWNELAAGDDRPKIDYQEHRVLLCGFNSIVDDLREKMPRAMVAAVQSRAGALEKRFEAAALQLFDTIQGILKEKPGGPVLIQVLTVSRGPEQVYTALDGLLKTARLENPNITGQVIAVEPDISAGSAYAKLTENRFDRQAAQIRYARDKRFVAGLTPVAPDKAAPQSPWKQGGVYLITGGLGGLGLIFARTIAANTRNATLILTGRSEPDLNQAQAMEDLRALGAGVDYQPVDVTDKKAVERLLQNIEQAHGKLTGILHGAGVNHDDLIIKKNRRDFAAVLAPKVAGTVNLDQAGKETAMDFFILFSSTAGVWGNVGQCDYAAANGFMDAYARYRNRLVEKGRRSGWTLSINWPLWQAGGMGVDGATEQLMRETTGMVAMSSQDGIAALNESLSSQADQVMVMYGDINRLYQLVMADGDQADSVPKEEDAAPAESDGGDAPAREIFETRVTEYLKRQLSAVLKVPVHRIDAQKALEAYGIDSVIAVQLTNQLEKVFGPLSKTLFFEYQSIEELSRYFMSAHRSKLMALLNKNDTPPAPGKVRSVPAAPKRPCRQRFRVLSEHRAPKGPAGPLDIAIIGLSGKYPQSDNIDAYWENLRQGKDCITQVPASRWDWRKYYSEDRTKAGRHYSKWGGFISDVDKFDPLFFGISPRQAELMDPQERLFLEHVWMAIEDAGYCRADLQKPDEDDLPGQVGVYAGVMYGEYQLCGALLGSSFASIANRVSYVLNLHGPSMTVDTMCSSALTSIHLACQDLKHGRTDLAVAGGVNVSIHPNKYLALSTGQFISSQGHCESFGKGGDGYIPGEGVGVVLLKRLSEAQRDGDHIYGVIKASAINHGGKTNGYTVPNPKAQQSAISRALKEAQIDPRAISYIEAHGTGTRLGDPIEIAALSRAFGRYTDQMQYCAIGSVKSNIGHCESAAGIAGLTKLLLQMQHKKLVPSLHSKELNPNIDFTATPFVVNQKLKDWRAPEIDGQRYGRIAGVSSFGAGGSNAHMVVEEYVVPDEPVSVGQTQARAVQMIVLSAKNEERLKVAARNLHAWTAQRPELSHHDLASIAHTLQVGREAMERRLGLIVTSADELREKLAAFLDGEENIVDLYRGRVKRENEALAVFTADEDLQKAIEAWIDKGKYHKLLDLWVKGLVVDWNKLHAEHKPGRISLPTYPFAKERYWVSTAKAPQETARGIDPSQLHPLVHQNTSDLAEQRFTSTFSGKEFFLNHHRVRGQKVLPGMAYLEMARAGITRAVGSALEDDATTLQLENIVWAWPLTVDGNAQPVNIGLHPQDDGRIAYVVYTRDEADEAEQVVYSHGVGALAKSRGAATLDLAALKERIRQPGLTPGQYYDTFKSSGLEYGEALQGIEALTIGEHEVLARLSLPACVKDTKASFVLHPSLMDAALQAAIGLGDPSDLRPGLPFALERLEILGACDDSMWAWVRHSSNGSPSERVQRFDMDLCDDAGTVRVQLKGFSVLVPEGEPGKHHGQGEGVAAPAADLPAGLLHLSPVWKVVPELEEQRLPINAKERVVVIGASKTQSDGIKVHCPESRTFKIKAGESRAALVKRFKALGAIDHVIWIVPEDGFSAIKASELIDAQQRGVLPLFKAIKALLALDYGGKNPAWTVITTQTQAVWRHERVNPAHAAVHGLVGALAKEYPHWRIRLVDLAAGAWPIHEILTLPYDAQGNGLAYRADTWFKQELLAVRNLPEGFPHYKQGGVYVVIGGAGGIGEVWSRWMITHYQARIIWIGRRVEDAKIKAKRRALSQLGQAPLYIQADATDVGALESACRQIKSVHAHIHGVVHAAIVLLDKSLSQIDERGFKKALAAKVDVSACLAKVFEREPLDFVLFFSSVQSFLKAPGQSNDAAGCTFEDAFAKRLTQDRRCAVKIMNWGYWGSVGGVADPGYLERMARSGIGSIEPQEGMEALEALLTSSLDQMALVKTLKPGALQGVNAEEWLSEHSSVAETDIEALRNELDEDQQMDGAKPAGWKDAPENPQDYKILIQLLLSQLQACGLLDPKQTGGVLAKGYKRWLETSIAFLKSEGYVTEEGAEGVVVDVKALWSKWDQCMNAWRKDPVLCVQVDLLDACMRALPDILTGKRPAVEVIFPNSSTALVEGIYKGNQLADLFNERLGQVLTAYMRLRLEADSGAELRILEIGAGTGGTTAGLLEKLKPFEAHIKEYGYTDLSKAFLLHAQEHYAKEHPYLKTQVFDVERPLASQQIEAGGYDVVIAANVLHATRDIRRSLQNCKAALRKGGLILINELSGNSPFLHLTFGLLEGWWLYQDSYLRIPGSPGLYPETWARVLGAEGFDGTFFAAEKEHALGQQIIAAQSNGVVRQRQAAPLHPRTRKQGKEVRVEAETKERYRVSTAKAPPETAGGINQSQLPPLVHQIKPGRREAMRGFTIAQCVAWDLKEQAGLLLKMDHNMLDESLSLIEFGFDSILLAQFARALTAFYGVEVTTEFFFDHSTIEKVGKYLLSEHGDRMEAFYGQEDVPAVSLPTPEPKFNHPRHGVKMPRFARKRREISPAAEPIALIPQKRFPEIVKLNESVKGRPVFWFHGGLGGVGVYSEVAEISQRPFYGIEARGYRTKRLPLHGVQAMAAYYIQALQSLQPEGPYDLGGYSFGGVLSYEIARQLQELGHSVDTIIMIDTFDTFPELSYKTLFLQNANSLLAMWLAMSDSKLTIEKLLHREELDLTLDDKKILKQIGRLMQERGFKMAEAELIEDIHKKATLQIAYELKNYSILPLSDSSAINCYYFRNKSGVFFGEMEPYLYCDDATVEFDNKNIIASETWKALLPNFHLFDLEASDHFTLLSDSEASETIKSYCRALYSEET